MRFNPDEYITVSERIEKFYAKFPQGRILTSVVEHNAETGFILIRAEVYRDAEDTLPAATGHAYELRSPRHAPSAPRRRRKEPPRRPRGPRPRPRRPTTPEPTSTP